MGAILFNLFSNDADSGSIIGKAHESAIHTFWGRYGTFWTKILTYQ